MCGTHFKKTDGPNEVKVLNIIVVGESIILIVNLKMTLWLLRLRTWTWELTSLMLKPTLPPDSCLNTGR